MTQSLSARPNHFSAFERFVMSDQLSAFDCLFMRGRVGAFNFRSIYNQLPLQDWLIAGADDSSLVFLNVNWRRFILLLTVLVLFLQDFI